MQLLHCMPALKMCRRVLAILLMACFFLPLAECQKKEDAPTAESAAQPAEPVSNPQASPREVSPGWWDSPDADRFVPAEVPVADAVFWVWLALLGGPLGCAILRGNVRRLRLTVWLTCLETGLEAYLLWCLAGLVRWGWKLCWGGWLALLAAVLLMLAAACEAYVRIRRWRATELEGWFSSRLID